MWHQMVGAFRNAIDATATVGGAVQFDTSGFALGLGTTSPLTVSGLVNVGSGSNGTSNPALLFCVSFAGVAAGTVSAVSVTWNGVSMPSIGTFNSASNSDMFLFGLPAPATGAHDFVLTWTGSIGVSNPICGALSVVGADQTGGATTFQNFTTNTATGTPATVTVTSATSDICLAAHEAASVFTPASCSGTDIGSNSAANVSAFAMNWDTGSASKTLTYTNTSSQFASMAVDIKAA